VGSPLHGGSEEEQTSDTTAYFPWVPFVAAGRVSNSGEAWPQAGSPAVLQSARMRCQADMLKFYPPRRVPFEIPIHSGGLCLCMGHQDQGERLRWLRIGPDQ